jgi:carbon-monoxide dehydrogenase iron sulfur subunit
LKKIYANEEVCIGCRLCEIHCIVQHSGSKNVIKAFRIEKPRQKQRVRVQERGAVSFALQCRHCKEPVCVFSCLTGAMYVDEKSGTVQHDRDKCIGCCTCILVCPHGAILQDKEAGNVVAKCDLCLHLEVPACVANCPNEALVVRDT